MSKLRQSLQGDDTGVTTKFTNRVWRNRIANKLKNKLIVKLIQSEQDPEQYFMLIGATPARIEMTAEFIGLQLPIKVQI